MEPAALAVRVVQYAAASVLFGSPLFFVYALPAAGPGCAAARGWTRPLVAGAAALLALSSLTAVGVMGSQFAGSFAEGFGVDAMAAVVMSMGFGKAALLRALMAIVALACLLLPRPGRARWIAVAALGAVAAASLAWMGHGGDTEGPLGLWHLVADMLHALAAALWIGALVAFGFVMRGSPDRALLHTALRRFSALGVPLVGVVALTGLLNAWVLVGPGHLGGLIGTPYGRVLLAKLALFAGMLALAARNRWRHTPALAGEAPVLGELRASVTGEAMLGLVVLALVAWLGTLQPPAAF